MAKYNLSLVILTLLSVAACRTNAKPNDTKKWCIAKTSADHDKMQGFLDFACSQIDCGPVQSGGACFEPNTLIGHTSYALNMYALQKNFCNEEIGEKVSSDPSYKDCYYPNINKCYPNC